VPGTFGDMATATFGDMAPATFGDMAPATFGDYRLTSAPGLGSQA